LRDLRVSVGSKLLAEFLHDRIDDLAAVTTDNKPPPLFSCADQWLLASALQKSIRRGDIIVARRAGHQLLRLDRARLWRRLMTVALEDIGIADIDVAVELIAISTLSQGRRLLGGDARALDIALVRACGALKNRTGDHFCSILGREQVDEAERAVLQTASSNALLAMLAKSDLPWSRRLHACALLAGHSSIDRNAVTPGVFNAETVLAAFRDLDVPPHLIAACQVYAARARDPLPICIPFAWCLWQSTGARVVDARHDMPKSEFIGDLPDYAFDPIHTRLGKRAVNLFLRSHLMKPPFTPRQIAAAIWNAESAACDRTLDWSMSGELRQRAHRADLLFRGLPAERHAELDAWIARERPTLTAARLAVWNSAAKVSGKPVEMLEQVTLPLPVPDRPQRRG
jgi:hypothetical protein